jgi:hypothetical protein
LLDNQLIWSGKSPLIKVRICGIMFSNMVNLMVVEFL